MGRRRIVSRILYLLDGLGRARQAKDGPETDPQSQPPGDDAPPPERPGGLVLWMHAPSAAQAGALPALAQEVSRLRAEPVHALLTHLSGKVPASLRPAATILAAPGDGAGPVRAFLDHFRPDLCLVLGLPDRPKLLAEAEARGIPLFLAFPDRGLAERRLPLLPASLLHHFETCLAPSGQDARLLRHHIEDETRVITTGPFSDTALTQPCDEIELSRIATFLASRPVWLAHHPDEGEIDAIEAAHRFAARSAHRLLLILLPRPKTDARALAARFERQGWRTARRSAGEDPQGDAQVFIADTPFDDAAPEDELWFRLSPIVFCGGTFTGQIVSDPYVAAAYGTAVVHGPLRGGETARYARLGAAGATSALDDPGQLGQAITDLLSPDLAAELALAGWTVISESANVIDRMARIMDARLDELERARAEAARMAEGAR